MNAFSLLSAFPCSMRLKINLYIKPLILYKTAWYNTMERRDCFGILDKVFPVSKNGFREIVPDCFKCKDRIKCLKEAVPQKRVLR